MTLEIVGLDLSLSGTGVSDSDSSRTIKTPPRITRAGGAFRLHWLARELSRTVPHEADLAVIEGYAYASHPSGHHAVVEWGGITRLWLHRHSIPYVVVAPTGLKKYATGNGGAKKKVVWEMAVKLAGDIFVDDNAADAWWLRQMGLAQYDFIQAVAMPEKNKEALSQIEWPALTERKHNS